MIKPPIEELLKETPGRFALVITAARRARNINSYFNQLGGRYWCIYTTSSTKFK